MASFFHSLFLIFVIHLLISLCIPTAQTNTKTWSCFMLYFLFFIPSLRFPLSSRSRLSKVPPMRSAASSVGAGWWGTWHSSQGQFSPSADHPAHTVSERHSHLDRDQRNRFVPPFPFSPARRPFLCFSLHASREPSMCERNSKNAHGRDWWEPRLQMMHFPVKVL